MKPALLLAALGGLAAGAVQADAPRLGLPAACVLGKNCFIQNYVDRDPGGGSFDFTCGPLSYDGHTGTDFALPDLRAMRAGVGVLAAAPGTVIATRDGMPDTGADPAHAADIAGRECGNGVLIDHGAGWQTQYCHLKSGSVRVHDGQAVVRGEIIGQIGQSGKAQFPHVHLSVRKAGKNIDPFWPETVEGCASGPHTSLWADQIAYSGGGLLAAGFSPAIPEYRTIKAGDAAAQTLSPQAGALVFWVHVFGARKGDRIEFHMTGPTGKFLDQTVKIAHTQARLFRATGRRKTTPLWPTGVYRGVAVLVRDGDRISKISAETTVK